MTDISIPLHIAADHPAFAGHFPGKPIVPGVVLLDEALQAIATHAGLDLTTCKISSTKFLSPVSPGEPVNVSYRISGTGAIQFDIACNVAGNERRVATGSIQVQDNKP